MVRVLLCAAWVAASATVAHAETESVSPHHHHSKKSSAAAAAAPAEDPSIPDQMRGWFEGAVGDILTGVDLKEPEAPAAKK